jgi:hypothetical protein
MRIVRTHNETLSVDARQQSRLFALQHQELRPSPNSIRASSGLVERLVRETFLMLGASRYVEKRRHLRALKWRPNAEKNAEKSAGWPNKLLRQRFNLWRESLRP